MTNGFKERYFKKNKWTLNCEVVTPMFLGNASQEAEWRAEPFKGLLRYWWRIAQPSRGTGDIKWDDLQKSESQVFGTAGDDNNSGGKSKVDVSIVSSSKPSPPTQFEGNIPIIHPETTFKPDSLSYLAGMGLIEKDWKTKITKTKTTFFSDGSKFDLGLEAPDLFRQQIETTLALLQVFGTIGGRSRNAWGSFSILKGGLVTEGVLEELNKNTIDWKLGFNHDYPNCLGKDDKGPLLWRTKAPRNDWQGAMADLAETYIQLRAGVSDTGIKKLDPDNGERHLLGIPLMHHNQLAGGKKIHTDRHASPLRLFVRKIEGKYLGFFLHVPHQFAKPPTGSHFKEFMSAAKQLDVWEQKIHKKLDGMNKLKRASYGELL